jgi:hypothetical protein
MRRRNTPEDLQGRIDLLKGDLVQERNRTQAANAKVRNLQRRLEALHGLAEDLDESEEAYGVLTGRIDALKADLVQERARTDAARSEAKDLKRRLGLAEAEVEALRTQLVSSDPAEAFPGFYAQLRRLHDELREYRFAYETLVGLMRKRSPVREDGSCPDWRIEDVVRNEERYRKALEQILREGGRVCGEFESCRHEACRSSAAAWFIADGALRGVVREAADEGEVLREAVNEGLDEAFREKVLHYARALRTAYRDEDAKARGIADHRIEIALDGLMDALDGLDTLKGGHE